MKKTCNILATIVFSLMLFYGCSDTMRLPEGGDSSSSAGINRDKNKYVRISPDWGFDTLGLTTPLDVYPSRDGRLYIADSSERAIRVIRPSGECENGIYDTLSGLPVSPAAVCLDNRFNVYFTDRGGRIYVWPQFSAMTGIQGIVTSREYGNGDILDPLEGLASGLDPVPHSETVDTNASTVIDSLLSPHVFYDPRSVSNREGVTDPVSGEEISGDPVYAIIRKSLIALAPAAENALHIYAMDAVNHQILKIRLIPTVLVKLENGQLVWHYEGVLESFVATEGTGAGTVSRPTGMATDDAGNIYYSQTGDFFSVHKLMNNSYSSAFLVGEDDIMDIGEFGYARDVSVASDGNIFVLDTLDRDVKMYSPAGEFLKSVAVREEWVRITDSSYVADSLVVQDTLVLQQYPDLLKQPQALTVYNEVLYTIDNGNRRILRFTRVDDVIVENPDREE
ncbi:MAG: hypothetical protein U5N26_08515 [Candidatus Marinimicrobia bacterium]|nr:hypothetical protein [Candidatus Neomarinimicrobiota bacterium]